MRIRIVGQGLAGTVLAWQALWRDDVELEIVALPSNDSASAIAAGLITPVTGRRLALTERIGVLWPSSGAFFARVSRELNLPLWKDRTVVRVLADQSEKNRVFKKQDGWTDWMVSAPDLPREVRAPLGFLAMGGAAVDVPSFVSASRRCFERAGVLKEGFVTPEEAVCDAVLTVFCEGAAVSDNPLFAKDYPFHHAKGEMLLLRVPAFDCREVLSCGGTWLFSRDGDDKYLAGATYERENLDHTPTLWAREQILAGLAGFLDLDFDVVDQLAGVRPIIRAQKILTARHPTHRNIWLFNGLGSKGVLTAPWHADRLLQRAVGE